MNLAFTFQMRCLFTNGVMNIFRKLHIMSSALSKSLFNFLIYIIVITSISSQNLSSPFCWASSAVLYCSQFKGMYLFTWYNRIWLIKCWRPEDFCSYISLVCNTAKYDKMLSWIMNWRTPTVPPSTIAGIRPATAFVVNCPVLTHRRGKFWCFCKLENSVL